MRIQPLSDLHNEFSRFVLPDTNAHVIALMGDIDLGVKGIEWAKTLGKPVVYVGGNHEPFRRQITDTIRDMRACSMGSDVHFLERNEVVLHGVRFLGCTLWAGFDLFGEELADEAMAAAQRHINDFNVIQHGAQPLTPQTTRQWHRESVAWLEKKLALPFASKTVVMTHHGPHPRCVHPRYGRDILSASFSSNLEHLMGKADLWLFGHSHMRIDTKVNGTRILSNPRGFSWFANGAENPQFHPDMVVSLGSTVRATGERRLMTNGEIHAMLASIVVSDIEISSVAHGATVEKGVKLADFPEVIYNDLYQLACRQGIRRDAYGELFVDMGAWREVLQRASPDT